MSAAFAAAMAERSRRWTRTLAISRSVSPRAPANAIAIAVPTESGESTILPGAAETCLNNAEPPAL